MSGAKYVFDTNVLISFFNGSPTLQPFSNAPIYLSVVSVVEFLSFPKIEDAEKKLLYAFLQNVKVIDLSLNDTALIETITSVRRTYRLKLPDATIAATALRLNAALITNDGDFKKLNYLKIITY